ncbi:hypothetical protein RF11_08757 [Thelohanellus kitauei]|uniref:Uncharacterized protein n=1 Tax=Thelohanellus kitauei TaxID=669202 RepID=A0A0C2NBD3_THEKT|nr:hypothetical protein RF11_08757 [Thelohanellus kitauei]
MIGNNFLKLLILLTPEVISIIKFFKFVYHIIFRIPGEDNENFKYHDWLQGVTLDEEIPIEQEEATMEQFFWLCNQNGEEKLEDVERKFFELLDTKKMSK